jgi:hypothetical protein
MPADGETPGCDFAIRVRSAPGLMRKHSGGSSFIASPSTPTAIGPSPSTTNSAADH